MTLFKKIEKFFDVHISWFFVNGRKREYYDQLIKAKWNL